MVTYHFYSPAPSKAMQRRGTAATSLCQLGALSGRDAPGGTADVCTDGHFSPALALAGALSRNFCWVELSHHVPQPPLPSSMPFCWELCCPCSRHQHRMNPASPKPFCNRHQSPCCLLKRSAQKPTENVGKRSFPSCQGGKREKGRKEKGKGKRKKRKKGKSTTDIKTECCRISFLLTVLTSFCQCLQRFKRGS